MNFGPWSRSTGEKAPPAEDPFGSARSGEDDPQISHLGSTGRGEVDPQISQIGAVRDDASDSNGDQGEDRVGKAVAGLSDEVTALTARVGALEAGDGGVREQLSGLAARVDGVLAEIEALRAQVAAVRERAEAERGQRCSFERVWQTAPLDERLAFIQGILSSEHPHQAPVAEAIGLVELWQKGPELENWLTTYPSLFADSVARLDVPDSDPSDAGQLAWETLQDARELLDHHLRAMGVEWIVPAPGDLVTSDHEVIGDEPAAGVQSGRVARVHRPGFRRRGTLCLPALVVRALPWTGPLPEPMSAPRAAVEAPPPPPVPRTELRVSPEPSGPASPAPAAGAGEWPDWLRRLQRASMGTGSPAVERLLRSLACLADEARCGEVPDGRAAELLTPLLPLLGPGQTSGDGLPDGWLQAFRQSREELCEWLRSELSVEVLWPSERAPFDLVAMEAAGTRRTAHPHEQGTVAKVERVGLRREGRVLAPARVVRYETGDSA